MRRWIGYCILLLAVIAVPVTATVYFATSAPGIITKGDMVSVSGTGAVNGTLQIWIIGREHFEVIAVTPDHQGNFSVTLKPSATALFSSGRYALIIQDPGYNGTLEIESGIDVHGNLSLMNRGKIIERFGSLKDLRGDTHLVAAKILSTAAAPGTDDTFSVDYFFVEEPAIHFDQVIPASGFRLPDQHAGERIVFSGTTNLGTENLLDTTIRTTETKELVTEKRIKVTAGSDMNTWTWDLAEPGLSPGEYILTVAWARSNTTGTATGSFRVNTPSIAVSPVSSIAETRTAYQDTNIFPIFISCSLVVIAIVLFYTGRD
jgi:hypothetical protein